MISKKLFDKIQLAIKENGKPRKKSKIRIFPFLNFANCGECGFSITGERQIKKSGLEFIYYRCTKKSKTYKCKQKDYLREEKLADQILSYCQKISIPDEWRDKFLDKVAEWEQEENDSSGIIVQNLKEKLREIAVKIDRLSNGYLEGAFELNEYQTKKNELIEKKKDIEEELSDFERKGNHRLELLKDWIIEANRADNLAKTKNFPEMRNFLKTVGSNRTILNGKLLIELKKPFTALYKRAERAVGIMDKNELNTLWWT